MVASRSITLPKTVIEQLYEATLRFTEILETLEVLLDKGTMRRIKLGEEQYRRRQYVVARGAQQIRRALSA